MSADKRSPTEERYNEESDDLYEERDPTTWFPFPVYGWLPWTYGRDPDRPLDETSPDQVERDGTTGSWWGEGLITLLFLVGLALFIFPEPATSGLGVVLVFVAVVLWIMDWAR